MSLLDVTLSNLSAGDLIVVKLHSGFNRAQSQNFAHAVEFKSYNGQILNIRTKPAQGRAKDILLFTYQIANVLPVK